MPKEVKQFTSEIKSVDEENLIIEHFISTETEDRSKDVVLADGMVINGKVVVLKEHGLGNMGNEPIAKPLSIEAGKNEKGVRGIIAKTQYFPDDEGRRLFMKAKDGYMPNFSIGFIPLISSPKENGGRTVKKWELVEYSQVAVPDNPEATTKSLDFRIVKKAVIPFKSYDLDPKDAEWSASDEIKGAEVEDLKIMGTWYDKDDADTKSSYKLPHHRADGYNTVFKALSAAVAALNGARGGVDIPEEDRERVYNHLAKHYKEFDEEAPELKSLDVDKLESKTQTQENDVDTHTNVKSLGGVVGREASYAAIQEITYRAIETIYYSDADEFAEKEFKSFLKKEVLPEYEKWYTEFFNAIRSGKEESKELDEMAKKYFTEKFNIKESKSLESAAEEPASPEQEDKDNVEPPAAKGLKFIGFKKTEPKTKSLKINSEALKETVRKAVQSNLTKEIDKLKGKIENV